MKKILFAAVLVFAVLSFTPARPGGNATSNHYGCYSWRPCRSSAAR